MALPNIFGYDPAVQVSRTDGEPMSDFALSEIRIALEAADINTRALEIDEDDVLIRLYDLAEHHSASEALRKWSSAHIVTPNWAPRAPGWFDGSGLRPMRLGLEFSRALEFLYEVDVQQVARSSLESWVGELEALFKERGLRATAQVVDDAIQVRSVWPEEQHTVADIISRPHDIRAPRMVSETVGLNSVYELRLSETQIRALQDDRVQQNAALLRDWMFAIHVADFVVQRQEANRIVVKVSGMDDPARLQRFLNRRATLEFRLVDTDNDAPQAQRTGRVPLGSILREQRDGTPVLLRSDMIASGADIVEVSAVSSLGRWSVHVRLNDRGARRMLETTQANRDRPMAILFLEERPKLALGDEGRLPGMMREERVIDIAMIRDPISSDLWITGTTPYEARDLTLLLRAGALAAPMTQLEARAIGPSLGWEVIKMGRNAAAVVFLVLAVVLVVCYRGLGFAAVLGLVANLVLIVGLLSLFRTLVTLPSFVGVVLSVTLAVAANVLIIERIRAELANGNSPLASIRAGYRKASGTIVVAAVTILVGSLLLWIVGSAPAREFVITLSLGSVTSLFTAIVVTRAVTRLSES